MSERKRQNKETNGRQMYSHSEHREEKEKREEDCCRTGARTQNTGEMRKRRGWKTVVALLEEEQEHRMQERGEREEGGRV